MPTKNTYRLINPHIEGSFETVVAAKNSFRAGKKMYENLSSLFTNPVEDYNFTLQNLATKENIHFNVEEQPKSDGAISFKLTRLEERFPDEIEDTLNEIAEDPMSAMQEGGKKKRKKDSSESSDDSSSSSDDYDSYPVQPVTRYVFYNLPYNCLTNPFASNSLITTRTFIPLFSFPVNPTVEVLSLNLPIAVPWR